jgi:hypothetical protein
VPKAEGDTWVYAAHSKGVTAFSDHKRETRLTKIKPEIALGRKYNK